MCLAANLVDGERFDPQVAEKLERLILGDAAGCQIGFIVGEQVLVHAPVGQRVAVGLDLQHHLQEPHRLHRLAKGLGRLVGHFVADAGHLKKLGGPLGVLLGSGLGASQLGIACRETPHRGDDLEYGVVKDALVDGGRVGEVELRA